MTSAELEIRRAIGAAQRPVSEQRATWRPGGLTGSGTAWLPRWRKRNGLEEPRMVRLTGYVPAAFMSWFVRQSRFQKRYQWMLKRCYFEVER